MACDLLSKWLVHYDPIHRGYTVAGMANGVTATNGWSFPRMSGGYNLYRGQGVGAPIDPANPVGAAGASAASISNFSWRPHRTEDTYGYVVAAIGGGGVESAPSHPTRIAEFDVTGGLIGLRPNSPTGLTVTPLAAGRFELGWIYISEGQEAAPSLFRVYTDNASGPVDYQNAIGSVSYVRGKIHYTFTTAPYDQDARYTFAVRAESSEGVQDGNLVQRIGWTDRQAPEAHPLVTLSCVED